MVGDLSVVSRTLEAIDALEGIDVETVAPEEARERVGRGGIDCLVAPGREVELLESSGRSRPTFRSFWLPRMGGSSIGRSRRE